MDVKQDTSSDHSSGSERLYLFKEDKKEVYVDCPMLQQHQIDALRFLYKSFYKKCPGAVLNFPPSCGKSTTVALYLKAVNHLLKDPILILCKDETELQYWKETLLKWSCYAEDAIAVESLNPFIKGKRVFLNTRESLASHLRRHWSVAVVKENVDMCKLKFETDFKIYITSTDIKKDLSLLSTVYTWLYPKPKHNILDFATKDKCPKERFRKSVQLDIILEDVAIRQYVNLKPFDNIEKTSIATNIQAQVEPKRVKNKDATGTKIKRSKKITTPAHGDVLDNDQIGSKKSDQNVHLMSKESDKSCTVTNSEIENVKNHRRKSEHNVSNRSIHNNSPIDSENFICDPKQLNSQGDSNELLGLYNNEKSKPKHKFYESLHIDAESEVDAVETKDIDKNELLRKCLLQSKGNNKENNSKINVQEINKNHKITTSLSYDNYSNVDLSKRKDLNKHMLQIQSFEFKSSINEEDVKIELKNEISENDIKLELKNELNHVGNDNNESIPHADESDDIQSDSVNIVKDSHNNTAERNENEKIKTESCDTKMKIEKVVNVGDKRKSDESGKDLDDKISLMEEKALKKFKGSLLDSIF